MVIKVSNSGSIDSPNLVISWRELEWSESSSTERGIYAGSGDIECLSSDCVTSYLRRVLSLDIDLNPFYETLARTKQLKELGCSLRGLRPALTSSVFDAAMWAIVGQQVTLGFALTLKERLAHSYGRRFSYDGRDMFASPTVAAIDGADIPVLRALQLSQRKSEYVLTLARAVIDGTLDLEALRVESYETACEKLVALRGIGKWTANYILMRGAGHLDALPLGDAGLRRAVRSAYNLSEAPSDNEIIEYAEPFRPYRSLYTFYLWQGFA